MHPRDQIILVISRIYKRGLTTTSGGNISIIDENGDIWVTPSAVDKGSLQPDDIVCVKKNGTISGRHKPSSEFPFHRAIYESRPDIKSVIHAHPPALVSFSIVRQIPNTNIISQARHGISNGKCPKRQHHRLVNGIKSIGHKLIDDEASYPLLAIESPTTHY